MIEIKNMSFSYPQTDEQNLKDINLSIMKGEVVAFIGLSGCGKSTLTRVINGLAYKFYDGRLEGHICLDKINPCQQELSEIGRRVGSIFQNPKSQFFAELVEDEIAFALENYGFPRAEILEKIEESLHSINGETLVGQNLFHLSSGEKQKVAIASINALDPPIYVFDEPSANLDMKSVESLRNLMIDLKKARKTLIISEHRIYYLKDIVDKYYYIENGSITHCYSQDQLLEKSDSLYSTLGLRHYLLDQVRAKASAIQGNNCLRIENLCFAYKNKCLFAHLNYTFTSGNIYGIIGHNGVGKSTLSKILSGLIFEQKGQILFNEKPLKKRHRRKYIYYLSNNPDNSLFEVTLDEELKLNKKDADSLQILKQFHLEDVSNCHPQILSGGQKQRLTIAAAELLERDVYIFDEPTSGLDGKNMRLIAQRMKVLQEKGKIVIIISHDYEFLMESCNLILHLDKTQLTSFEPADEPQAILNFLKNH